MAKEYSKKELTIGLLALQAIALATLVVLTLPLVFERHKMDVGLYFEYSLKLVRGLLPYRDFALEYPPLALLPFTLPRLAVFGQPIGFDTYVRLFLLENIILSTLVGAALTWVVEWWTGHRDLVRVLLMYILFVAITAPLLPWRYDLFPAFLTVLALLCILRGQPVWAGVWLGLGAAAKLYPLALLPVFGAYYFAGGQGSRETNTKTTAMPQGWRALVRLGAGCAGAIALTLVPFALTSPGSVVSFLRYHEMRGLQVESLPAGAIILIHLLGRASAQLTFNYGAIHLVSPLATTALRWLPTALIAVYGAVVLASMARFRAERTSRGTIASESLVAYSVAALLAFIATNKVFSPQYLIWLLPFAPLLRLRHAIVIAAICAITIGLFPFDYDDLLAMHALPVIVLNARNFLVVGLLIWLLIDYLPSLPQLALSWRQKASSAPRMPDRG
jgi:uncharacterized membrane protein